MKEKIKLRTNEIRIIEEAFEEIERLKRQLDFIEEQNKYINKLEKLLQQRENIIKEVREKLLCYGESFDSKIHQKMQKELLEILDKENK